MPPGGMSSGQGAPSPSARRGTDERARAGGDEALTVIAGYHWFTDWGRDTMISLEGLTLPTRRYHEAGSIVRTFGHNKRFWNPDVG
jgi:predicted glycogen debranching enzyme